MIQKEAFLDWRSTTPKQVADKLFKNEPNRGQKASVKSAMEKLFADCRTTSNASIMSNVLQLNYNGVSDDSGSRFKINEPTDIFKLMRW